MNQEIIFLNVKNRTKDEKVFYIVEFILGNQTATSFISKELYEKITSKKIEMLKRYQANFNIYKSNNKLCLALNDIII